jgi:hypothetical protein
MKPQDLMNAVCSITAPTTHISKPLIVRNESTIWVDVDQTLIVYPTEGVNYEKATLEVVNPNDGVKERFIPHAGHIKILKQRKGRGSHITVWSAGGYAWAEAVVKALGLEAYVDLICTKPHIYIDDKEAKDIMGERVYLGIDGKYGG